MLFPGGPPSPIHARPLAESDGYAASVGPTLTPGASLPPRRSAPAPRPLIRAAAADQSALRFSRAAWGAHHAKGTDLRRKDGATRNLPSTHAERHCTHRNTQASVQPGTSIKPRACTAAQPGQTACASGRLSLTQLGLLTVGTYPR